MLTWLYIIAGLMLISLMLIIADQTKKNSFMFFFVQNIGLLFLFISLLVAYSGVHRINSLSSHDIISVKELFKQTGKKSHYIIAIVLGVILIICFNTALQLTVSMISHIPYAGPIIIVLLTIPFLLLNLSCFVLSLFVIIIMPPMIAENKSLKIIINDFINLIRTKGLYILSVIILSLALFFLCLKMVYYITGYSTGITKAVQWKINITYPVLVENFIMESFISDIIRKIGPRPDTLETLRNYGFEILDYISVIKYSIGIFFYIAFAFIFSFPFAAYFTFLSNFYKKIKE
jgi:hypothetical protein